MVHNPPPPASIPAATTTTSAGERKSSLTPTLDIQGRRGGLMLCVREELNLSLLGSCEPKTERREEMEGAKELEVRVSSLFSQLQIPLFSSYPEACVCILHTISFLAVRSRLSIRSHDAPSSHLIYSSLSFTLLDVRPRDASSLTASSHVHKVTTTRGFFHRLDARDQ